MAKEPDDQQAHEFQLRPGVDPFGGQGWKGVNTESDPGSLQSNELQRGQNIRLRGKRILTRSGMTQAADVASGGQIMWMKEAPSDNPNRNRLWFSVLGCFGASISTGGSIQDFDPSNSPQVEVYGQFFAAADKYMPLASYAGDLYVGDNTALRKIEQLVAPQNVGMGTFSPSPPNIPAAVFPGFKIVAMLEFDSKLFVSLQNTSAIGSSKISVWDGVSVQDDITGIRPAIGFGIFQNTLVAGFDATAAAIQWRPTGAAGASWTSVGLAGFQTAAFGNCMQEVGPKLFIAGGSSKIYSWDGTSLVAAQTITGCATDGVGVTALTLHNGLLHYGWNKPNPWPSLIGRHDPDSSGANEWVDSYKDVTGDSAPLSTFSRLGGMASYRQQLLVGGSHNWLAATVINDVKGTPMETPQAGTGSNSFNVMQLIKFP